MRNKYSLNAKNQLLIKPDKQKAAVAVKGKFGIDKNNRLVYWLNEPSSWRRLYDLPNKINFAGNWKLNSNYDLELKLQESASRYKGGRLIFKGEIISTDRDTLVFEVVSLDKGGSSHIQLLALTGSWHSDESNRIIFKIKKQPSPDVITLEGAWQINKNQQITYVYEKTLLKRKTRVCRVLTFEGFWQINSANRITYILLHSTESYFDFHIQLESPNLYPKEGLIKYRIGIGFKKGNLSGLKVISLYGNWKFSRKAGLIFSIDYGKGKLGDIEFGANAYLNRGNEVVLSLANKQGEPLGLNITFNHKFLERQDAQAFLRFKNILDKKRAAIEAGARIPF